MKLVHTGLVKYKIKIFKTKIFVQKKAKNSNEKYLRSVFLERENIWMRILKMPQKMHHHIERKRRSAFVNILGPSVIKFTYVIYKLWENNSLNFHKTAYWVNCTRCCSILYFVIGKLKTSNFWLVLEFVMDPFESN